MPLACRCLPATRSSPLPAARGVTLSVQYSGFLGGILGRLIAGINRRYIALEADGLKRRAEAQAAGA